MCIRDRHKGAYSHPGTCKKQLKPYNANVQNINTNNNNHNSKNSYEDKSVLFTCKLKLITLFTRLSTLNQRPKPATQPGNIKVNTAEEKYTSEMWVSARIRVMAYV